MYNITQSNESRELQYSVLGDDANRDVKCLRANIWLSLVCSDSRDKRQHISPLEKGTRASPNVRAMYRI